ncbi:MAG: porin family protein [Candidatus Zixiibacteriota bacterium]
MRRIVIVLAVVLLTAAFAQATELGFKAGLNLANLTGDVENNKAMMTFGGGAFAKFMVAPQIFIKPEVVYMMKGTKGDSDDFDEKMKFNYIEIPVLLGYQFPTQGSVSPSLFVGPAVGILMSAKYELEGVEVDIKDFTKSTDFGLVLGGGVDFGLGTSGKLAFDARYTVGLTNLNDDVDADEFEFKNTVFSFFVGYAFPIGQ